MGMSLRAQAWLREQQLRRAAERRAAQEAAEAHHAEWLDRYRAAEVLGVSVHQFKRLVASGRGPAGVKSVSTKQSPVRWRRTDLIRWQAQHGSP
jgi:hypothetical protein